MYSCITTLIVAGVLLSPGLANGKLISRSISHLWSLGYGTVSTESLIGIYLKGSGGLIATVLLANAPQLLLSFLYLTYNGLFTCMLLVSEWSSYSCSAKPLRVTSPVGLQRSTYRLQLPYRYGVPLLVISGTLHWLVSQSIFLARIAVYDSDDVIHPEYATSTCGYSCIALITVIIFGFVAVLLVNLQGYRQYDAVMPLVGSCSAAISAACHRPADDADASIRPVMWGALVEGKEEGVGLSGVGHCCFTTFEVEPPVEGRLYAGSV